LTVWAAGNEPVPFVQKLLSQVPKRAQSKDGRVIVDSWMRVPMHNADLLGSVFVLGDAASFHDKRHSTSSKQVDLPQTAQVAGQQGAFLARLLNRGYDLTVTPPRLQPTSSNETMQKGDQTYGEDESMNMLFPNLLEAWLRLRGLDEAAAFSFLNLGLLAYVGGGEALSQVQVGDVPIFSYAGSVAFVLWRSVYLVKQVASRNRVLVTFDWFKTWLFGRDVTRF
jgi:NADH dehydrogenase FAD-containing subunit